MWMDSSLILAGDRLYYGDVYLVRTVVPHKRRATYVTATNLRTRRVAKIRLAAGQEQWVERRG